MADRNIQRFFCVNCKRYPDQPRLAGSKARGFRVHAEHARRRDALDIRFELLEGGGNFHGEFKAFFQREHRVLEQRGKVHLLEKLDALRFLHRPKGAFIERHLVVNLEMECGEVSRQDQCLFVFFYLRLQFGIFNNRGVCKEVVDGASLFQNLLCSLGTDAGHARNIVR